MNLLQTVSLLNTAQTSGKLSRETMVTFYTEKRFPDEILRNEKPRTLFGLVWNAVCTLVLRYFPLVGWEGFVALWIVSQNWSCL